MSFLVLNFSFQNENGNTLHSPDIPLERSFTFCLCELSSHQGKEIRIHAKAVMGQAVSTNESVVYAKNGKTAIFEVCGTSADFSLRLLGIE